MHTLLAKLCFWLIPMLLLIAIWADSMHCAQLAKDDKRNKP